ncbi:MAG: hypothetical protein VKL39_15680 [Leptolyngbyaceae bacterium]|nr:hypothetical protein [Leptolyngbyaceae bacterium]
MAALFVTGLVAPAALADSYDASPQYDNEPNSQLSSQMMSIRETEAFNLVSLAYRGELEEEGVPSYSILTRNIRSGDITARDIVQAGIEDGYLRSAALEDEDYLNAVDLQMDALTFRN